MSLVMHDQTIELNRRSSDKQERQPKSVKSGGESNELWFALLCGIFLLCGWLLWLTIDQAAWVSWGCYLFAYFFGGYFMLGVAWRDLRSGRFNIDLLMLVAAIGAGSLGEWAEGALLLFLFSLGHGLETYALGRAKRAMESLAELTPQSALVRREGKDVEVAVEQLRLADRVLVKPHERIAADGFVLAGISSVDQAPITGESIPVEKQAVENPFQAATQPDKVPVNQRVFAGTINGNGALEIQVTKLAGDSTLARVVQMVRDAEVQKSPTQRFADQFERIFVPLVLVGVLLLLFAWVVIDESAGTSFYRAMSVLVAASPCALAISTPSAVLSGIARAARNGVLIKGGAPLENLGNIEIIAFDKTGTLTTGNPHLTDVIPYDNLAPSELLKIAVAVEMLSDHPLAAAVVRGAQERGLAMPVKPAEEVQSITGRGVQAKREGEPVLIGNLQLFSEVAGPAIPLALTKTVENLQSMGRTTMIVRLGDVYLGALGLMDTPRPGAKTIISRLRELGIRRMTMLSGDNQQVATAIATEVGLTEAIGGLMPEAKVDMIKTLRTQAEVAMVGDGVNDAPAMAYATVGIAMGAAGSDVALETADVALMADDLSQLAFAVGLSRQTSRIIRQNLWFSLGMVAFLVPATLLGLRLGPAVMLHEGSTLLVVFNALRLLGYQNEVESP